MPTDELPDRWPEAWTAALSDPSLQRASSAAIFLRGRACARAGAVEVVSEDPMPEPALHARVDGTDSYTTEVWIEDDAVAGSCDCPHAADGWFCKHQVAVALVWRDRVGGAASVPSNARRAGTARSKRQTLVDFLHSQDRDVLADKLLEFADRDRDTARELQQWHQLSTTLHTPSALKSLINQMLSTGRSGVAWNETLSYVARAEKVLPLLQQARARDTASAASLCLHALRRSWAALETADDSEGDIADLCRRIGAVWVGSLQAAGPQPAGFGDTYLQVRLDDPIGCFDAAAAEAAIGTPARRHYRQALAARWRHAKDAAAASKASETTKLARRSGQAPIGQRDTELWQLEHLHLAQLEREGEIDAMLAVLREDLGDAHAHGRVVTLLEAHGRFREAFAQAERGRQAFPNDMALQNVMLRCYERDGWTAEALALRRQQFERWPDVERYQLVLKAGVDDGQDVTKLRLSLHESLRAREDDATARNTPLTRVSSLRGGKAAPPKDVSVRAEILCAEGRWLEACEAVAPPARCRAAVVNQIAVNLPAERAEQAVELLLPVFDQEMRVATSPYRNALRLVGEIASRLNPDRRSAWLTQLRAAYKSKRNFIGGLPPR